MKGSQFPAVAAVLLASASNPQTVQAWVGTLQTRWTSPSHATKYRSIERTSRLSAFQSFRWSNDEFSPLSASRGANDTTADMLLQAAATQTSLAALLPETNNGLAASTPDFPIDENTTTINAEEKPTVASLPIETTGTEESVLGINPSDIEVVQNNSSSSGEKPPVLTVSDMFRNAHFVDMFRGSANYIANHRDALMVFHIPGDWIDHPDTSIFRDLMNDISLTWLLGIKIVIVVGCRYQVEKRVKDRETHLGMVVTDNESLRIVKEEAGYVRFEVERQLARSLKGSRAALDGNVVSGNFYSAQPFGVLDGVDYKYSGFVRRMETEKIHKCHDNRDIVLLTTLGVSPTGEVFNVNSEYLAAYAGGALGASKVIYFLEDDVELRHKVHGYKIPHLRSSDARNLLVANDVSTEKKGFVVVGEQCPCDETEQNMLVKLGWAMKALERGVKRVHVVTPENGSLLQELYTRDGAGTMISADLYDGIQQAKITDVSGIHDLITPLIEQGTLVDRPKDVLERDISQYHVYTRDDLIVACGQLKMFENGYAEIGCLVVSAAYRAKGRGDAMLGYLERLCLQRGASVVFVLSTQTMEWFVERGFDEVPVEMLPPSRRAMYNKSRASKIYMKRITNVRDLDASELFWNR